MRLHLFGYPSTEPDAQPPIASRVLRFLSGEAETLDAELAAALLVEFSAQEAFRLKLVSRVSRLVAEHKKQAADFVPMLDVPYAPKDAYQAGYLAAQYHAFTECAQAAQNALNEMSDE